MSTAPIAQGPVDVNVRPRGLDSVRLAALFVQPDGCYAGLPVKCCASSCGVVQSCYATQRPQSSQGISSRLSSSQPREGAIAYCSVAKGQPRESSGTIPKMGEGKPGQAGRETARVAGEKQREAPADATRMAGTSRLQPEKKRSRRPRSSATQEVWSDRGRVLCSSGGSGRMLRYLRTARPRNEKLFTTLCRSLSRNWSSPWPALQSMQHYAWKREGHRCGTAVWGGLS